MNTGKTGKNRETAEIALLKARLEAAELRAQLAGASQKTSRQGGAAAGHRVKTGPCPYGERCNSHKYENFVCEYSHAKPKESGKKKRAFGFKRRGDEDEEEKEEEEAAAAVATEESAPRELCEVPPLRKCWNGSEEEFTDAIKQFAAHLHREGHVKRGDERPTGETSSSVAEFHNAFREKIESGKTVLCFKQRRDLFWVFFIRKGTRTDWRVSLYGEGIEFGKRAAEEEEA
jgi:hypothetical protein